MTAAAAAGMTLAEVRVRPAQAQRPAKPQPSARDSAHAETSLQGLGPLSGLDGRPLDLRRQLGRPLLLNVWATWCAPCLAEIPSLQTLRDTHGPGGNGRFDVVAVNAGQSINQVEAFLKGLAVDLPIVMDPQGQAMSRWKVRVLPTTLLFDASGFLRTRWVGERDWSSNAALQEIEVALQSTQVGR
jgi:thiol-disulfide isomerase/thioredoxin